MPPEPAEPHDDLEAMFAADEAAIRDDGFSPRVIEEVGKTRSWRKTAIYGSSLAGLGFAVGGIFQMAPHLKLAEAMDDAASVVKTASVGAMSEAWHGSGSEVQLAIVAVIAGVSFLLAAVAMQSR